MLVTLVVSNCAALNPSRPRPAFTSSPGAALSLARAVLDERGSRRPSTSASSCLSPCGVIVRSPSTPSSRPLSIIHSGEPFVVGQSTLPLLFFSDQWIAIILLCLNAWHQSSSSTPLSSIGQLVRVGLSAQSRLEFCGSGFFRSLPSFIVVPVRRSSSVLSSCSSSRLCPHQMKKDQRSSAAAVVGFLVLVEPFWWMNLARRVFCLSLQGSELFGHHGSSWCRPICLHLLQLRDHFKGPNRWSVNTSRLQGHCTAEGCCRRQVVK